MIWSVIGDLTERLAQQDNYDNYGVRKPSYLQLAKQWQNRGHQSKFHVPWAAPLTHHRTQNDA